MIKGIVSGISGILNKSLGIVDKFVKDKDQAAKLKHEIQTDLLENRHEELVAQIEGQLAINKEEAKHDSLFVAGWRPFIGWICGAGLGYHFILRDFLVWGWSGMQAAGVVPETLSAPPELNIGQLVSLIMGMLGLGGWRSFERAKGKERNSLNLKQRRKAK